MVIRKYVIRLSPNEIEPTKYRTLVDAVVALEQQGLCDIVSLPEYVAALE